MPCLQQLAGYNLAVITNGDEQQQTAKLQKNGLMPFFSDIVCANSYGCAKPSLQLFNIAMERSNTTAELCVNVGDTLDTDIKPLGKLGIIGVLIDRKAKGIKKEEGYYRIGSLEYLPILLQQLFEE